MDTTPKIFSMFFDALSVDEEFVPLFGATVERTFLELTRNYALCSSRLRFSLRRLHSFRQMTEQNGGLTSPPPSAPHFDRIWEERLNQPNIT